MKRRDIAVAVVIVALVLGGVWWWHWQHDNDEVVGVASDSVLTRAMTDLDGETRTLDDWSGQTRLVNFWATWCAPCRVEMPLFQEAYERYADQSFEVIGIALDEAEAVKRFGNDLGITYPLVLVDNDTGMQMMNEFANAAGVVPHSILLSPDGRILDQHLGPFDEAQLDALLEKHVK